jgi:integrase
MAVRKIRNAWWVDFRTDYIRYRKRSPENTKSGAEAYESALRQRLARGEPITKVARSDEQELTFRQFAWQWFQEYVVPNNKASEQRNKRHILNASLIPFFGKFPIRQITSHHIELYKAATLKKDIARKSVNNRLTVLRKCLVTAYEWLELPGALPKVRLLKCPPAITDYLSADECALLLSHAEKVIREMILTALRTGMRQGELKGLQWSSIDWQNQIITVRHSRCDYTKQLDSPKSNRARHIPIDVDVYAMLFKRKKDTGYVFLNEREGNQPFNGKYLAHRLAEVCAKAKIRKIGWHALRHTFASHLAMRGVPLNTVQMLMGHSVITTTMRYAHVAPSTLRAAINTLNPKTMLHSDFGHPVGNGWLETLQKAEAQTGTSPENTSVTSQNGNHQSTNSAFV